MKDIVRKNLIKLRMEMNIESKYRKEVIINEKIEKLKEFANARVIAIYYPINNEVSLLDLFEKYKKEKIFVFPKVKNKNLCFGKVSDLKEMVTGKFGIKEPKQDDVSLEEIDLIFVPGVAFDTLGYRIGYGGGYYDRLLANKKQHQCAIGVCFEFQLIDHIAKDDWDRKVDILVTERTLINTKALSKI